MSASQAQINKFLSTLTPIAQRQAKKHNNRIFASVCVGQAAHESGFGTSAKMVKANALFGIKVGKSAYHFGTAWKGAGYKTGTTEYYDGTNPTKITDWFRAYDIVEDAVEDYFDMLCHCQRYKGALNQSTPQKCIEAIVKGGYATGPNYAKHVMALINNYNLTTIDDLVTPYTPVNVLPVLKKGSRGVNVKIAQEALNRFGYNLSVDGKFGPKTEEAVKDFQRNNKLVSDGIIGKKTWEKLM